MLQVAVPSYFVPVFKETMSNDIVQKCHVMETAIECSLYKIKSSITYVTSLIDDELLIWTLIMPHLFTLPDDRSIKIEKITQRTIPFIMERSEKHENLTQLNLIQEDLL